MSRTELIFHGALLRVLCSQDHRGKEISICGFNNTKVKSKQLPLLSSVQMQRFLFEKEEVQNDKVKSITEKQLTILKKSNIIQNSQFNIEVSHFWVLCSLLPSIKARERDRIYANVGDGSECSQKISLLHLNLAVLLFLFHR